MRHGLSLHMGPCQGGYSYQWEDGHGKVWCSGWHDGSVIEATKAAEEHLDGAMGRTPFCTYCGHVKNSGPCQRSHP